jgi:PAS domain S-box-containing protein
MGEDRTGEDAVPDDPASRLLDLLPPGWDASDLWSSLFESAPLAYVLLDLRNEHVMANRKCYEIFGYGRPTLGWMPRGELGHPDDQAVTRDLHLRALEGDIDGFDVEKRYKRSDSSFFWAHLVGSVLCDRDDQPWAMLISIEDITARVEAEAALKERESRFRSLVQNATDAIVVVDADANLLYASPSAERLVGLAAEEFMGGNVLDFIHPDDHLIAAQTFGVTVSMAGVHEPLRMRACRADGSVRFVEVVSTNLLDDPAVNGVVINIRDLTDTEQVTSALEMTENRYRRMLENISDTVTLLDANATVLLSTGNLRSIMGYETDFWENRNAFDLVHPDDQARMAESFAELLDSRGVELSGEVRTRTATGEWIDVEITAINLLDDPDVQAMVLTTRNVTDRKRDAHELAEARDQAVKALRMRTEFIASVSHELRTPIHGILGLSELLATADLDEEARNLARSIGRATEALRMVLDDILDFAKIEVGRLEVNMGPINALELADDLEVLFGPQARAKGIGLVREVGPRFPQWVIGDGLRVRQVLNNLLGNAIKFTAEGEVRVRAERVPGAGATEMVRITVSDTGIGIPPDAHDRLFEPFSQVHGTTTREFGGTGLGLSIAKRLVELMGGVMGFESTLGEGSRFWFDLPLVEAEVEPPAPAEPVEEEHDEPTTGCVLVVEDNPINQLLVRRQLGRLGYDSVVVDNGIAALELFPTASAGVILMDWQLPGIDGLETTRRLRAYERDHGLARTPVIAMTASALPGDRDRCLDAGMDDFIAKPVSMATLGEMVGLWLERSPIVRAANEEEHDASVSGDSGQLHDQGEAPRSVAPDDAIAPAAGERAPDEPPARTAFDPSTAIDADTLDHLVEELADPMLVVTVVRTYLRELGGRVAAITAALEGKDRVALASATHTLKSTSAAVGAVELADRCLDLEQFARLSSPAPIDIDGDELRARADAVTVALEHHVRRLEGRVEAGAAGAGGP